MLHLTPSNSWQVGLLTLSLASTAPRSTSLSSALRLLQGLMTLGALQQSGCKACPPARCSMAKMPQIGWRRV